MLYDNHLILQNMTFKSVLGVNMIFFFFPPEDLGHCWRTRESRGNVSVKPPEKRGSYWV